MALFRAKFPLPKTWWAKQITDNLYSAGRLAETQFKYALESGFKSILSLHESPDTGNIGVDVVPNSRRMKHLAETEVGLYYKAILQAGEKWQTKDSIDQVMDALHQAPGPTLLHCDDSFASTFCCIYYLALHGSNMQPKVTSAEFYRRLASVGHSCPSKECHQLISDVTGEPLATLPLEPHVSVPDWFTKYWLVRPVCNNTFVIGQMRSNYIPQLIEFGFTTICNLRYGLKWRGKPSQEEVTLQNIRCYTETYDEGGRQTDERLQTTRTFPGVSNSYIREGSPLNYQTRNPLEFGDDIGYNERMMKEEITAAMPRVKYIHTPCGTCLRY